MDIFVNQEKINSHSVFSSFWKENILVGLGRKYLGPTIYFLSSPPNQTHSKKVFLSIFSPKFSIHHISPPNKHKGKKEIIGQVKHSLSLSQSLSLSFSHLGFYLSIIGRVFLILCFSSASQTLFKSLYFSNPQMKL